MIQDLNQLLREQNNRPIREQMRNQRLLRVKKSLLLARAMKGLLIHPVKKDHLQIRVQMKGLPTRRVKKDHLIIHARRKDRPILRQITSPQGQMNGIRTDLQRSPSGIRLHLQVRGEPTIVRPLLRSDPIVHRPVRQDHPDPWREAVVRETALGEAAWALHRPVVVLEHQVREARLAVVHGKTEIA